MTHPAITANYVGIADDWQQDKVIVWERTELGREAKFFDPPRYFFVEDEDGEYMSMYGHKLKKISSDIREEFKVDKQRYGKKFESDISPLQRVLMDYYYGLATPPLNYAFFDIEARVFSQKSENFEMIKIRKK